MVVVLAVLLPMAGVAGFGTFLATTFYSTALAPPQPDPALQAAATTSAARCASLTPHRLLAIVMLPPPGATESGTQPWGRTLTESGQYEALRGSGDQDLDLDTGSPAQVLDAVAVVWCALHAGLTAQQASEADMLTYLALGTTTRTLQDTAGGSPSSEELTRWQHLDLLTTQLQLAADTTAAPAAGLSAGGWTHPLPGVRTLQGNYGQWRGSYAHTGEDLSAPLGTAILAAAAGTVTHVSCAGYQGRSPCNLIIDHGTDPVTGQRVETWYVHMYPTGIHVTLGQHVQAGQHIADVGSNGNSTGPHLHLEVHLDGRPTDPARYFLAHGIDLRDPRSSPPPSTATGSAAVAWARTQLGVPYLLGAGGPDAYDCSGLTQAAYRAAGLDLPRTARQQYTATTRLTHDQLQPGDLVFWSTDDTPAGIYHVALYSGRDPAGHDLVIQAPAPGRDVEEHVLWTANLFAYGRAQPATP